MAFNTGTSRIVTRPNTKNTSLFWYSVENDETNNMNAQLAEMYSEIIKLSSQNKINAKNSWSLDLIDHMDRYVLWVFVLLQERKDVLTFFLLTYLFAFYFSSRVSG